jgi:diguanylate cyclase
MGGDEFTILLEEVSDPSNALRVAKRILSAVAEPLTVEGRDVLTSASVLTCTCCSNSSRTLNAIHATD